MLFFTDDILQVVETSDGLICSKCFNAKCAFFLSLIEKRAVCLFASHGGLGGRLDEVCFQTGVTHYVCVFSCWAEGWMIIMAISTTASSRFSGWKDMLQARLIELFGHFFIYVLINVSMYPGKMFESTVWSDQQIYLLLCVFSVVDEEICQIREYALA